MTRVTDVVLAVDAGGTKYLGGAVDGTGSVSCESQVPTPRSDNLGDPGLAALLDLVGVLRAEVGQAAVRVRGLGVGMPEYVHDGRLTSREVLAWDTQPADLLVAAFPGLPVCVDADVRCAALAEARVGWSDSPTVLYVSWGTGLSSTLVVDGRPVAGRRGEALALGELPVSASVDPSWQGNLEDYASGLGIADRYAAAAGRAADGRDLAARAADGDTAARAVLDSAAGAVAHALRDCTALLDPDVIVLGGGIGSGCGPLPEAVTALFPTLLTRPGPPPLVPARLGSRAGLVGAGLLAWAATGPAD